MGSTPNHRQNGGQWVLLGTYPFSGGGAEYVQVADQGGNSVADAVRFNPLAGSSSQTLNFVHTDHLGTPQAISDGSQQVVWQADYQPFGKVTESVTTISNDVRFPGQYFDVESGLHYNYFRDYEPGVGRYVQSDPIGLDGGANRYAYAYANPLGNIDSRGLDVTIGFFGGVPGHVGVGVSSSPSPRGQHLTYGLYPLDRSVPVAFCFDRPGIVKNDQAVHLGEGNNRAEYLTIKTTEAQDALVKAYIDAARHDINDNYNLCVDQCTDFVRQALRAGGIVIPPGANNEGWIKWDVPGTFFRALERAYAPAMGATQ